MNFNFSIDKENFKISIEKKADLYDVLFEDEKFTVKTDSCSSNEIFLTINERKVAAYIAKHEKAYYVSIDGTSFQINDLDDEDSIDFGSAGDSLSDEVTAPMPGKVIKILVKPGDIVKSGQKVAILEAMKMENELSSPKDGKIAKVFFNEGDLVDAGKRIVEFE